MDLPLIQKIIIFAIPIIFAITVHEVAHGWVAYKLGDHTAKMLGRLTLNPIKHIDPIGTVLVPALLIYMGGFLFGWAKPVPVDWRNLRNPKRDMAYVAVAGPASNLIMAIIWAIIYKLALISGPSSGGPMYALEQMCYVGIGINTLLMILNLFPVPPLDGSRVMASLLPPKLAISYNKLEPFGLFIVLALLMTGVLFNVIAPFIGGFMRLLEMVFSIPL
jgi:Zn-dependent protease